jgi:EAL domain-containing protein (putative c-di-GMP-specific phosphodiesterase class I)
MTILAAVEPANRIPDLGLRVHALCARWAERLPADVLLFVNLHPAPLGEPALDAHFAALLPHAHRVVLEITERASLRDFGQWESALAHLEIRGFRFALDDLGSGYGYGYGYGYGGLNLLADLRPAFIKLDRSIVRDVDSKPQKQRLVDLLTTFANASNAVLNAEGVETRAERDTLVRAGAHLLHGYHFARPSLTWPVEASPGRTLIEPT